MIVTPIGPEIAERLAKQLGIVWRPREAGKGKAGSKSRPLRRHMSFVSVASDHVQRV
jgi:hypothetical protein